MNGLKSLVQDVSGLYPTRMKMDFILNDPDISSLPNPGMREDIIPMMTFRFLSKTLDPDWVTEITGVEPISADRSGRVICCELDKEPVWMNTGIWYFDTMQANGMLLEQQLKTFMAPMLAAHDRLKERYADLSVDFSIAFACHPRSIAPQFELDKTGLDILLRSMAVGELFLSFPTLSKDYILTPEHFGVRAA